MRHEIGAEDELPVHGRLCREISGRRLMVIRTGTGLFACSSICTHEGSSMEDGVILEDTIECPLHGAVFRLSDGAIEFGPAEIALQVYPVSVVNRRLVVDLPELAA